MPVKHIFRVQRNKDFVTINKTCLKDKRLSLKAKGLHCLMLAQKDDWIFHLDDLVDRSADGIKGTRAALNELKKHGYLHRYPEYENGKIIRWVTDVYEYPQPTLCKPCGQRALSTSPFCTSRKATSRKRDPNNNNSNNKNNLNKNNNVTEQQNVVDNDEQLNNLIEKKLKKMPLSIEDRQRLKLELLYHVNHRPDSLTIEHALNAACKLLRGGKWSTPKGMANQETKAFETRYEQEKLKERQEAVESEIGQMLGGLFRSKF